MLETLSGSPEAKLSLIDQIIAIAQQIEAFYVSYEQSNQVSSGLRIRHSDAFPHADFPELVALANKAKPLLIEIAQWRPDWDEEDILSVLNRTTDVARKLRTDKRERVVREIKELIEMPNVTGLQIALDREGISHEGTTQGILDAASRFLRKPSLEEARAAIDNSIL